VHHTLRNPPKAKAHVTPSEHQAVAKELPGSLTARDILKKVFDCAESARDDEILERVGDGLSSGSRLRFNSFTGSAFLTTLTAKQWVESSWSSFILLNQTDQQLAALAMVAKLNSFIVRREGRPKGAMGENTAQRIRLAAALQFLGCSRTGMVKFLYPEQHKPEAGKQAVYKLLGRHRVWIDQECLDMNETLAFKIIKASVTKETAELMINPIL
jgi:hypothetical protein